MFKYSGQGVQNLSGTPYNKITFFSFTMNEEFEFLAFLTDFQDSFKSSWSTQEIYGKMDPISTFKNTTRKITFAFDIPNHSLNDSIINMSKVDRLIKGLYPIYNDTMQGGTAVLASPPLFRIKFANFIYNNAKSSDQSEKGAKDNGLLGYLDGFDFKPQIDSGFFIYDESAGKPGALKNNIYPKLVKASISFNVIHEHPLGSKIEGDSHVSRIKSSDSFNNSFPHNFNRSTLAQEAELVAESESTAGEAAAGAARTT